MGKGRLRRLEAQAEPVILCVCGLARPFVLAVRRQKSDGEPSALQRPHFDTCNSQGLGRADSSLLQCCPNLTAPPCAEQARSETCPLNHEPLF